MHSVPVTVRPGPIVVHTGGGDTVTTVIAAVGLVLAVLSFGWQAWSFIVSGSRVTVTLRAGMSDGSKVASLATAPSPEALQMLVAQGLTKPVYSVHVHNRGRGPTSVRAVELVFSDGGAITHTGLEPSLPHRLDGESDATWHLEAELDD
jgi:hypothetical protein